MWFGSQDLGSAFSELLKFVDLYFFCNVIYCHLLMIYFAFYDRIRLTLAALVLFCRRFVSQSGHFSFPSHHFCCCCYFIYFNSGNRVNVKIVLNSANAFTFDWLPLCNITKHRLFALFELACIFLLHFHRTLANKKWDSCRKVIQTLTNSIGSKFDFGCAKYLVRSLKSLLFIYLFFFSSSFSFLLNENVH